MGDHVWCHCCQSEPKGPWVAVKVTGVHLSLPLATSSYAGQQSTGKFPIELMGQSTLNASPVFEKQPLDHRCGLEQICAPPPTGILKRLQVLYVCVACEMHLFLFVSVVMLIETTCLKLIE